MGYALRKGVSFCFVAGRALFLDVPRDRYFCLSQTASHAFRDVVDGTSAATESCEQLVALGILEPSDAAAPIISCDASVPPDRSLAENTHRPGIASRWETGRAMLALNAASFRLRYRGLERTLADIRARKVRLVSHQQRERDIEAIAQGYRGTRTFLSDQDRCLVRSLAISRRLLAAGVAPDLVLAVKLQPFQAHCWVQLGPLLINERREVVRDYTAILIV
ncbi:MAG TPA: lasso peptide biosynthesis B2 protein [Sphingomonas sp.]